jgi:hypothetical protein
MGDGIVHSITPPPGSTIVSITMPIDGPEAWVTRPGGTMSVTWSNQELKPLFPVAAPHDTQLKIEVAENSALVTGTKSDSATLQAVANSLGMSVRGSDGKAIAPITRSIPVARQALPKPIDIAPGTGEWHFSFYDRTIGSVSTTMASLDDMARSLYRSFSIAKGRGDTSVDMRFKEGSWFTSFMVERSDGTGGRHGFYMPSLGAKFENDQPAPNAQRRRVSHGVLIDAMKLSKMKYPWGNIETIGKVKVRAYGGAFMVKDNEKRLLFVTYHSISFNLAYNQQANVPELKRPHFLQAMADATGYTVTDDTLTALPRPRAVD